MTSDSLRWPILAGLAALVVGCGGGSGDEPTTTTGTETTTTTTVAETTTTTSPGTTGPEELPGERIEIFPYEGAELIVVGVEADDVLNVRVGPGVDFEVVVELEPLAEGIVATGHNRQLGSGGIWAEIRVDDLVGWANTAFLLQPGRVEDITSRLWPDPADRPRAETMVEMADLVAPEVASQEPPSDVVIVDGPRVGDLGEVVVDVIGFGDDAVGGERLHIFAEPDEGGEGFVARTVESTILCTRGVTEDGRCV